MAPERNEVTGPQAETTEQVEVKDLPASEEELSAAQTEDVVGGAMLGAERRTATCWLANGQLDSCWIEHGGIVVEKASR